MAWNPQINFSLRDDEIPFGDLIFDGRCIDIVTQGLLQIRDGNLSNIETLKQVLTMGCYTDDEFDKIRKEFEDIKQDIAYFKQLSSAHLITNVFNWAKRVDANVGYITGSNTWIEKYED